MRIIGSPVSGRTSALVGGAGGAGAAGVTTGWGTDGDATTGSTPRANADDETAGTRRKGGMDGARAAAPPGTSARRRARLGTWRRTGR